MSETAAYSQVAQLAGAIQIAGMSAAEKNAVLALLLRIALALESIEGKMP